jgi:hypothetical protein
MWEKPYISIFVEIGALRNFTHFGGHLKNGCQNDCHFEIALVTITIKNVDTVKPALVTTSIKQHLVLCDLIQLSPLLECNPTVCLPVSNYSYFPRFNRQQTWRPATGSSL